MRWLTRAGAAAVLAAIAVGSWSRAASADVPLAPPIAYAYGENETARSLAMGGALRALGNGTTAVFSNPANMALSRLYHIEALGQLTPESTRALGGASIVDSITSSTNIAGGLSLVGGVVDPVDPREAGLGRSYFDVRLAAAVPLGERFFIGLGARYMRMIQDGFGALDDTALGNYSAASGGLVEDSGQRKPLVDTLTFDAGATVRIGESFHIGIVGQNLTHPGHAILPTTVGGGFGYGSKDISVEVDGVADFDSWGEATGRFMAGGEYLAADHYPIRLGYRFDQGANVHAISGGFGYIGTEFAIEGAIRRTLSSTIGTTMLALTLTYHLESSGLTRTRVSGDE
jgi:hypothetical protein